MKLPPELLHFHTMLRRFLLTDEDHWNIPSVALLEDRIGIYIHFVEGGAEFPQERRNGRLGFVAEVAPGTRVESDITRPTSGKADVFNMSAHRFSREVASYRGAGADGKNRRIMTSRR